MTYVFIGGDGASLSGLVTSDRPSQAPLKRCRLCSDCCITVISAFSLSRCWWMLSSFQGVALRRVFAVYQRKFYIGKSLPIKLVVVPSL